MSGTRISGLMGKITVLFALLSVGGSLAFGDTIYVKVGGTGDGSSWATACGDLQTALDDADPNDDIWVAEGMYTPGTERWETFMMKEGVGVYGGFPATGDPGWDKRDPNTYKTILSGDLLSNDDPCTPIEDLLTDPCRADNSMHIMNCSNTDTNSIIGGLTITGGNANGSKPDNRGGGIYNYGGGVRINNCVFARNTASDLGGGVLINSMAGAAFINCIFEDNYSDRCGGAIYNGDWVWMYSEISLTNCTFRNNSARQNGGALDNSGYTASTVINCTFLGNKAGERGGAISSWTRSDLNFTDCMFSGNNAVEGGGAVANYSTNPNISKCTFVGNSADKGGGVYNESSDANVSNCHFSDNKASLEGGGMYNFESHLTVSNCTFNGNSVYGFSNEGYGGGMSNRGFSSPTVSNCTFIGNSVDGFYVSRGGGINNDSGNSVVTNCTFSNNSANGLIEGCGGGMANFNNSVVTNCTFIGNSVDGSFVGYGGGMASFFNSVVTNCILSGNSAAVGGGMRNVGFGGGMGNFINSVVTNCTLSGNSATVGGGMGNLYNSVVTNCTLSGNLADNQGGGIHILDSTTVVSCCILWGNVAPNDPQIYGPPTVSYSDIQGGYPGISNIDTDPHFVKPGCWDANGVWVDGDYHLLSGSPCVDAGDPNFIADPNATDLDGNPRIVNDIIDMGAYEFFVPPVVVAMRFTPQALNCRSYGNWVKAHLTLPQGFTVEDVDADRPAVLHPFGFESAPLYVFVNKDKLVQIEAAFDRQAVCSLAGDWPQALTVAGFLTDGNIFLGTSTVRIIHPSMKVIEELAFYWLNADCVQPDFCDRIDMNRDSLVNLLDYALLQNNQVEFVSE